MKFILGTKENMTEYFSPEGQVFPVTVIKVEPMKVTKVFDQSKDGYNAVQVGYGNVKESKLKKSVKGTMKGATYRGLKEFRLKPGEEVALKEGDEIKADTFAPGDKLTVSSVSKGKGFQGVVKRHGFSGGPRTHGQKHSEREPGSIGGGLRTHVPKGMKMAGRMGGDRITQRNLKVVLVDTENNLLLVKGAVAGRRGTLVEIVAR